MLVRAGAALLVHQIRMWLIEPRRVPLLDRLIAAGLVVVDGLARLPDVAVALLLLLLLLLLLILDGQQRRERKRVNERILLCDHCRHGGSGSVCPRCERN